MTWCCGGGGNERRMTMYARDDLGNWKDKTVWAKGYLRSRISSTELTLAMEAREPMLSSRMWLDNGEKNGRKLPSFQVRLKGLNIRLPQVMAAYIRVRTIPALPVSCS